MMMRVSPEEICARSPGRSESFARPVRRTVERPAASNIGCGGERRNRRQMLARQNFGRRHQRRLAPGLRDMRHGERRDDGLAGADIALHQPQHALIGREIGADFVERAFLRAGQLKRQVRLDRRRQPAGAPVLAPRRAPQFPAHQPQRQLLREQLVEREALAGETRRRDVAGLSRMVQQTQALAEAAELVRGENGRILPLGQIWQALQRALDRLLHEALLQSLGQPMHGFDQGQLGEAGLVEHAIGMNDLAMSVVKLQPPGDPAGRANGQAALDPLGVGEEKHQHGVAGFVLDQHLERPLGVSLGPAVFGDAHLDQHQRVERRVFERRPRPAVDDIDRRVKQKIDRPRLAAGLGQQPIEQDRGLGSNAGQGLGAPEQGIENGRTHAGRNLAE